MKHTSSVKIFLMGVCLTLMCCSLTLSLKAAATESELEFTPPPPPPPMPDFTKKTNFKDRPLKQAKKQAEASSHKQLLEEIQKGVALKPVDKTPAGKRTPTTTRDHMMEQIKEGVALKKVEKQAKEKRAPSTKHEQLLEDIQKGVSLKKVGMPTEKSLAERLGKNTEDAEASIQSQAPKRRQLIKQLHMDLANIQQALDTCKATAKALLN